MKHQSKSNQPSNNNLKINGDIKAQEVLVISIEGQTIGPCSIQQALQMARDIGLDLVEVSPNTKPPVCKILDYGKYKYSQNKKNRNTVKKKQSLKEIRMQPKISDHDLLFKKNHTQQFLLEGNKVKVSIRFKGRELAHPEIGKQVLQKILGMLTCNFNLDKEPIMEGRTMSMLLSPSSKSQGAKKVRSKPPSTDNNVASSNSQDTAELVAKSTDLQSNTEKVATSADSKNTS